MRKGITAVQAAIVSAIITAVIVAAIAYIAFYRPPAPTPPAPTPPPAPEIKNPEKLVVLLYGEPEGLDPATVYDFRSWQVITNVYDRLVTYEGNETKYVVPMLAERWEVSEDGRVYTFYIRKGVKFHDGTELTAEDVAYSLIRVIKMEQPPSWMLTQCLNETGIEVVDKYTVRITLAKPYAAFLKILATPTCSIVSKKYVEEHGGITPGEENPWMNEHAMGTGPFKVKEWVKGEKIVLEAFPDYWRGAPKLKEVEIRFVPEVSTRIMLLKKGEADVIIGLPYTHIPELLGAEGVEVRVAGLSFDLVFFVMSCRPPLDDIRVRQALCYAFPYDEVVKYVYHGYAIRASGPIPKGMFGYYEYYKYEHDLTKAKELLEEAGVEHLEVELCYGIGDEERKQIAIMWQAELAKIGVTLKLREIAWPEMYKYIRENMTDMIATGWGPDYADPDDYADPMGSSNLLRAIWGCYYSDPELDRLIQEAKVEVDPAKRAELYKQIQIKAVEGAYFVWIAQTYDVFVARTWVKGYVYNPVMVMEFFPMYKGWE